MGESLRDRVNEELKAAMKSQDKRRVATLRLITAAFRDREIQARGDGKELTEADLQALLAKMIKQRKESAEAYDAGGRPELAAQEREEIAIIEEFLPRQLTPEEMAQAVDEVIAETGAQSLKDMGRVMGALKSRYAGQMDMAQASRLVKERLNG
ncbi:GatB/YqeY domain-containing protein [Thermopetrobacter sp. TC1]|uniref:GatB/YqeY domain-containing protein n=1 Tax=Thermopetrobacter sp. TC1 TaxID=1495045 RepID=UPI00056FB410|nr:GatB/YqeY domain-containing protein [Thermopetrobacter sp. TC1]